MITDYIVQALKEVDPDYCKLSKLKYEQLDNPTELSEIKYLERPYAYEFYYQFRKLIELEKIKLENNALIQGEVDKNYQKISGINRIPDFLIHSPSSSENLGVIEFKLASRNYSEIKADFDKLLDFKRLLRYEELIEVLIGDDDDLEKNRTKLKDIVSEDDHNLIVIFFNTSNRTIEKLKIKY